MDTLTIPRCGGYCAESLIERDEERLRAFPPPVVSWLTDVELHSALAKKVWRGELAEEDAERVQDLFRTLDALHLAVAHRRGLEVLTADEGVADAGRTFELDVELMRASDSY
ncbi:hypothetical protein [Salinibacter ruber]|uniref:hypothetical protein n=1 Tax=Salinibacter ruber TaxID=146919 RepID=UPI00216A86D9|nr:hypothetical protein [Salinibacter ruber]MCS3752719.1 putative nucleic acid-binding protein [Salinibacter ruber]MCS4039987.1 putative nucleic acid-binding protein [Salinibacter ruber]